MGNSYELSYEIVIFPMKVHRKLHRKIALPGFHRNWDLIRVTNTGGPMGPDAPGLDPDYTRQIEKRNSWLDSPAEICQKYAQGEKRVYTRFYMYSPHPKKKLS